MKSKIHEHQKNSFKSVSKKTLIVALFAFGLAQTQAQVTFKPGLRGGLNFAHFTKGDYYNNGSYTNQFSSKTDFYVGFYGALHLSKFYTLQPEFDYSNQGSTINSNGATGKLNASYLSVAVINKFTFNDKFNILLGPAIDFIVDKNFPVDNDVDLTFQLGAGYEITKNFGLEARIKKGLIPAYYNTGNGGSNHTNVVISLGATYTFDVK